MCGAVGYAAATSGPFFDGNGRGGGRVSGFWQPKRLLGGPAEGSPLSPQHKMHLAFRSVLCGVPGGGSGGNGVPSDGEVRAPLGSQLGGRVQPPAVKKTGG